MNQVDCESVQQVILLGWANVPELDVGNSFNVSEQIFLTFQVNGQANSFFAGSSCSAGSVNVIINFFWRFELDDKINTGDVQSTGSDIG